MAYIGKRPAEAPLTADDIENSIITSAKIVDGTITGDDLNSTLTGLGTIGSGAITSTGVVIGTTVEPSGDTAAGDNAAIGYTSAEGLILTGQGSTNDVTIKNDADADVLEIPTGTTNVTVVGNITSGGSFIIGSASMSEVDLEKLDGITNGAGAANKALVLDGSADVASGLRNLTASGTVTFASLSDGSITATAFVDEDDMSSDSATLIPTQQSVKAYVDSGAGDITSVVAGTGLTGGATSGAATVNVIGGTGITANADDIAIDSTVTTLTGSQTLTNKTLTAPQINTNIDMLARAELRFQDASGGEYVAFEAPATVSSSQVYVLPSADGSDGHALKTDGSGTLTWGAVAANTPTSADGQALGSASLEWSDLFLADGAVVNFGDNQEITLTHVADVGLTLTHTAAGDNTPIIFNLKSEEDDIIADEVIGTINFTAGDSGGTDAILTAAGISAIAEDTFAADNNATKLSFKTAASEAAAEKMSLSSGGNLDVTGDITGATLNADGDTAAGDNAAIGYTSAEGLILTGQGSTSDVTLKNDADGTVFTVPTGTDDILFPDNAKAMWGASSDMTLYHDATNSYITNAVGALKIATETSGIAVTIGHTTSVVTIADNCTVTDTLTFGSLSDGSITATAFVDEDNMASDSATLIPTQQSVKAYVDTFGKAGYVNSGKHGQWIDGSDNYDLAQSESPLVAIVDAFNQPTSKNLDQMDPVGSTDTVDCGSSEAYVNA